MPPPTKVAIIAHSGSQTGSFSNPAIKTITKAGQVLWFFEALQYIKTGKGATYNSSSVGSFDPLSDNDCTALFGAVLPVQDFADTGLTIAGDVAGAKVYAMRGKSFSFAKLGVVTATNNWTITLMACRNNADPLGTIAVVSMGTGNVGTFTDPNIQSVSSTASIKSAPLKLAEAKSYVTSGSGKLYNQSTFDTFEGLTDSNFRTIFGGPAPIGEGLLNLGVNVGGTLMGNVIYAVRGQNPSTKKPYTFAELGKMAKDGNFKIQLVTIKA